MPAGLKRLVRAIPKKVLKQIADEDPTTIDDAMLSIARQSLGVRSDDAAAVVLIVHRDDRSIDHYEVFGDAPVESLVALPKGAQQVSPPGA